MDIIYIPYIIILNSIKVQKVHYNIINKDLLNTVFIDKIVDIMNELYDNELESFDDFIYRQKRLPKILQDITNSQYISFDGELKNYKNFIISYFNNNNDHEAIEILYFDNNKWNKYDIPKTLVYNIYKIKYLS
jgi:hypothetical protein